MSSSPLRSLFLLTLTLVALLPLVSAQLTSPLYPTSSSSSSGLPAPSTSSTGKAVGSSAGAANPFTATDSLCVILYSLPGNVDYPFSIAYSLQVTYKPAVLVDSTGLRYVSTVSATGTRAYTNKFGAVTTAIVDYISGGIYLDTSVPFADLDLGFTPNTFQQLPGSFGLTLPGVHLTNYTGPGGFVVEYLSGVFDYEGQAFLSTIPGFANITIGASNQNSLAVNYAQCAAPLSFTNGLRPSFQPTAASSSSRFLYSYTLSDGVSFTVTANLTVTCSSPFASNFDALGNAYQLITNITGTRTYTYLGLTTGSLSVVSQVTGASTSGTVSGFIPANRWYPYSLLVSSPGVYTTNTAPYVDGSGIQYSIFPVAPYATVVLSNSLTPDGQAVFGEDFAGYSFNSRGPITTQLQTYTLL